MRKFMTNLIAVVTLISSAASIAGYVALLLGVENTISKVSAGVIFTLALAISLYVLFVRDNPIARNVEARISPRVKTYDLAASAVPDSLMSTQEGEFRIVGPQQVTVQFEVPFLEPPEIELVNIGGALINRLPSICKRTRFQFEVARLSGWTLSSLLKFSWG